MTSLNRETRRLEEAGSQLISDAFKAGADAAEVCGSYGSKSKISLEKQDYHLAASDEGYQFGLRVLKGQRQGFASTNSLNTKELKEVASRAVEIATFSPENPYFSIQSVAEPSSSPNLTLWDPTLALTSLQTQKEWIEHLRKEILKDKRIRLNEGSLEVGKSLSLVVNSKGTHQLESETYCTWSLMAMAADTETLTSFDYFSNIARQSARLGDHIVQTTARFREGLLKNLKIGTAPSYKGKVVFSPRAVLDILIEPLCYHLNGRVILEGSSRWNLQTLGEQVLSPLLNLRDTAWLADRFSCGTFDREGTPTQNLQMIEAGVLGKIFLDHYSAKGLHQTSTGHASGGSSSLPSVGPHTLLVAPGTTPLSELMRQTHSNAGGLLLVHRFSGQTDPVTGDFSGVAKGAEWWANGEFQFCVKETLISGNVFECLSQSLLGLSTETSIVDSSSESPAALIDGISVTSG